MKDRPGLQSLPQLAGYSSWLYQKPCNDDSGDLFVCVPLPRDADPPARSQARWLVALGDVSGKGEAASHLKHRMEAAISRLIGDRTDPASLLRALNDDSLVQDDSERFATLVVAVIDGDRHELTLANAGHVAPIVRHADRRTEPLAKDLIGFPLWIVPGQTYEEVTVAIGPEDMVILHSDGVTAITGEQGCVFGHERLRQPIAQAPDDAESVGLSILQVIEGFRGGRALTDDITLLCLGRDEPHEAGVSRR